MDTVALSTEGKVIEISTSQLGRALTAEMLAEVMMEWLNTYASPRKRAEEFVKVVESSHHTLQGTLVNFLLAVMVQMGKFQYTDPRNEVAIATCKKVTGLLLSDILHYQPFI